MSKPDLLHASGLPAEIQTLIRDVVSRTRLWRRERRLLTLELIAHFADGMDAGRSAEDLIKTFGDAKLAARLMRRAKKRNRPLWWHFGKRSLQACGVFVLLYMVQMAILLTGRPEVKVDYVAQICAAADAVPENDRAWPIYHEAWLKDPPGKVESTLTPLPGSNVTRRLIYHARPGDPDWDQVVDRLRRHSLLLEAARAGAAKSGMGIRLHERRDPGSDYRRMFSMPVVSAVSQPIWSYRDNSLDCPEFDAIRQMVILLLADMRLAQTEEDAGRIVRNCEAMAGLQRQLLESHTLIAQLLCLIQARQMTAVLADVIETQPDLLRAEQYLSLVHTMPAIRQTIALSFESDRKAFHDLLQRIYTDDGHGDGQLTREGAAWILGKASKADSVAPALSLPLASAIVASRREMARVADEHFSRIRISQQLPLRDVLNEGGKDPVLEKAFDEMRHSLITRLRLFPFAASVSQFTSCSMDAHITRSKHDALTVALALEAYRKTHGDYPANLESLVPNLLPAIPNDPLHNQPMRYVLREGRPVIYTAGQDGIDRGGLRSDARGDEVPKSADWVLFPPNPNR